MKKRYTILVLTLIATVLPMLVFGKDTPPPIDARDIAEDGGLEGWFMHAFAYLDVSIGSRANSIVNLGKALGGVTALIYFGYLGWQMQAGDKEWSLTPFIRPLFICVVILNWVAFTNILKAPFDKLTQYPKEVFSSIEKSASEKRTEVAKKRQEFRDYYNEKISKLNDAKTVKTIVHSNAGSNTIVNVKKGEKILDMYVGALDVDIKGWGEEIFAKAALIILRVCVYLIFFIQKIWLYILVLLGPMTVAFSILPGFESGFTNWLSKFFSISLYTFIAYTIINLGQQLIVGGYEMEISRMQAILDNEELKNNPLLIINYDIRKMMSSTMMPSIIAYIVTGIGVLMTPTIADTIVSAGSAGLMSKTRGGASKIMAGARLASGATKSLGRIPGVSGIARGVKNISK